MPLLWWSKKAREEALWLAVKRSDGETVQKLLKRKSLDANAMDHTDTVGSMTPLHYAALYGKDDVLTPLLDGGAYIDARDERGWTPLFNAVYLGNLSTVQLLLSRGAGVNVVNHRGETPLFEARFVGILDALIAAGADLYWKNTIGSMALHSHITGRYGSWSTIEALLDAGISIQSVDKNGNTALHLAAMHSTGVSVMDNLIARGASVSSQNNLRQTPLHYACHNEFQAGISCLLKAGADIHVRDQDGLQVMHVLVRAAFAYDHVELQTLCCLQLLVSSGAKWDVLCDKLMVLLKARNGDRSRRGLAPLDTDKLIRDHWSTGTQLPMNIAHAVRACVYHWATELSMRLPLTAVPSGVVNDGLKATKEFLRGSTPEQESLSSPD